MQISAYVKDPPQINKYNGGKETIVNRIKVPEIERQIMGFETRARDLSKV